MLFMTKLKFLLRERLTKMIEYLKGYLDSGWKTKEEIVYFLNNVCGIKINERALRDYFSDINKAYGDGKNEYFIAHSNSGYLLTTDPELIMKTLQDYAKRSFTMLKMYYRGKKNLSERNQISLSGEDATMYEILSRMED